MIAGGEGSQTSRDATQSITHNEIPYRPESTGVASQLVGVLLVLALLLAACLAAALYARKRGWLDKWVGPTVAGRLPDASLRVEQALRLSARTTLYRVKDEDQRYLVVESTASARVVRLQSPGAADA